MNPDMSVDAMLDRFVFVVKGSRVIDRTATDWSRWLWYEEKYVKHLVYTLAEMRAYFRHRVRVERWARSPKTVQDPFNAWFMHRDRFTEQTLSDAMRFADRAARGLVEPRIDVDEMLRRATAKNSAPPWTRLPQVKRSA
ncbi:MAG: hypothetical protein V9E93_16550 [Steroidobacteraceae bacterium]